MAYSSQQVFTKSLNTPSASLTITASMGFQNIIVTAFDGSLTATTQGFTIQGTGVAGATASTSASLKYIHLRIQEGTSSNFFDNITITNVDADYCTIVAY